MIGYYLVDVRQEQFGRLLVVGERCAQFCVLSFAKNGVVFVQLPFDVSELLRASGHVYDVAERIPVQLGLVATFDEVGIEVVFPAGIVDFERVFLFGRSLGLERILHRLDLDVVRELVPDIQEIILVVNLRYRLLQGRLLLDATIARVGVQTDHVLDWLAMF